MGHDLLVNVKYQNISRVKKSLTYHSAQKRLMETGAGNYVFFISFNPDFGKHYLVGYLVAERTGEDNDNPWGVYTVYGRKGYFTEGKDFESVRRKLVLKIGDETGSAKSVGMATQQMRILENEDTITLLDYLSKETRKD